MNLELPSAACSGSPSKPECHLLPDVPDEDAHCGLFTAGTLAESTRCLSPSVSSSVSNEESMDGSVLDSAKIITDDMVKEEERLYESGVQEEQKRIQEEENLLHKMSSESREERYERLKFLLSKSKIYTEYLVNRIKQQKIEEEQRRQKQKVKNQNTAENGKDKQEVNGQAKTVRGGKRKQDSSNSKSKRQKKNETSGAAGQTEAIHNNAESTSEVADQSETVADEPALIEKASTFGVEDVTDEKRYINGVEVPYLQPKLMAGGILRPYQIEGYSWLKVMYENAVNGILADEMGLGKTVQCIAILSHLVYMGVPGPFLICAPLSTIPNWLSEFQLFAPAVPTVLFHGSKDMRIHLARRINKKHQIRENVFVQPVVITSYEMAMCERKTLARHEWKYLIVDEGHRIKNTHCRLIRELRMYRSTHRLLLTGTPLQNNLSELWSLLNFLLPEIFDDLGSFETWFDVSCMNDAESEEKIVNQERSDNILSIMHQILSPFMLRRLKSDVDFNIPPKKEVIVYAPLTQKQKEFYSAVIDRSILNLLKPKEEMPEEPTVPETSQTGRVKRRTVKSVQYSLFMENERESKKDKKANRLRVKNSEKEYEDDEADLESWVQAVSVSNSKQEENKEEKGNTSHVKTSQVTVKICGIMMQLRKCCNHPYLLEHPIDPKTGDLALNESIVTTSGKMCILDQMLAELKKRGHRVLLFSQMTRMLDLIEDYCHLRGYKYCRLDGSTSIDERKENMIAFNKPNSDKFIFLLSTRAGGLGINLTAADTVIIYDSDWNPQCDLQAQDRCHRIGQNKPVVVYRFVAANTIDEKIIERAAAKRKLEKIIIHKGKFKSGNFMAKGKAISPEELRDLLNSKDHDAVVNRDDFVISKVELNSLLDRSDLLEKWKMATSNAAKGKTRALSTSKVKTKKQKKGQASSSSTHSKLFKVIENEAGNTADIQCDDPESTGGDTLDSSSVIKEETSNS